GNTPTCRSPTHMHCTSVRARSKHRAGIGYSTASSSCLYGKEERSSASCHRRAAWATAHYARPAPGCVDLSRVHHTSVRLQALTSQHYGAGEYPGSFLLKSWTWCADSLKECIKRPLLGELGGRTKPTPSSGMHPMSIAAISARPSQ